MDATLTTWGPRSFLSEGYFEARVVVMATSALVMLAGAATAQPLFLGAGAAGLCMMSRHFEQLTSSYRSSRLTELAGKLLRGCGPYQIDGPVGGETAARVKRSPPRRPEPDSDPDRAPKPVAKPPASIDSTTGLVAEMLRTNRYALLLRPETAEHLSHDDYLRAIRALDERMALTPEGAVLIGMAAERATLGEAAVGLSAPPEEGDGLQHVEASYVDRYAVTNADYQHFVDSGGYEQLEFWPEEALPALFEFVDSTGCPGPRYWADGQMPPDEERLPVVGVSWFEATAYARWVGKRLPYDAEWTKACAWPIESAPGRIAQRRYPWGESFDARRANLWGAGVCEPVEVDSYPEGVTVGGLEQMIGNVWEWTADTLDESTPDLVRFPSALRSVRGGAYNTYFENQATCHFQSGEHPLARRANIGIRLALDMAGLASPGSVAEPDHCGS